MRAHVSIWLWVKTNGTILGVGAPPVLVYFGGDWDVHSGYDLNFHPWPYGIRMFMLICGVLPASHSRGGDL